MTRDAAGGFDHEAGAGSIESPKGARVRLTRGRPRGRIDHVCGAFRRFARVVPIVASLAVIAACASVAFEGDAPGVSDPRLAVERFLGLVSIGDYAGMGHLFGTADGPVSRRDPPPSVERRMYALASLLAHDGASVGGGTSVPGRAGEAVEFGVSLTRGGRIRTVPFVAVRGPAERWFVERVDLVALAGRD